MVLKEKKIILACAAIFSGLGALIAQPPPPVDSPPCWPPPCVPVDNGIVFAICAAVIFGGLMVWRSYKLRVAGK